MAGGIQHWSAVGWLRWKDWVEFVSMFVSRWRTGREFIDAFLSSSSEKR